MPAPRVSRLMLSLLLVATSVAVFAVPQHPALAAGLQDKSALTVHEGNLTITENGALVENLEIRGTLRIEANNVTVRNVWVWNPGFWTIYVASGSAVIEHVEIGHKDHPGERGIGGGNVTGRFLDIHHVEDGIKLSDNVVYENVHIHDLDSPNPSPHIDAIQDDGGAQNVVVRNSILDSTGRRGNGNAAVIVKSDLGSSKNQTFAGNYLNGGNYVVFVRDGGHGMPQNITFENNRIGPDQTYGLLSTDGSVNWTGNVWDATGEPAEPDGSSSQTTTTSEAPTSTTAKPTTAPSDPPSTASSSQTSSDASSTTAAEATSTTSNDVLAHIDTSRVERFSAEIQSQQTVEPSDEGRAPEAAAPASSDPSFSLMVLPLIGSAVLAACTYIIVRRERLD